MGGQLPSKAHVNFRQFTAVLGIACKLPCAVVNLNFHNNLQCHLLTKTPLFMQCLISCAARDGLANLNDGGEEEECCLVIFGDINLSGGRQRQ